MTTPTTRPSSIRCLLVALVLGLLALTMTLGDAGAEKIGTRRSPQQFISLCYDAGGQTIIISLPDGNVIVGCYFPDGSYVVCDYSANVCDDQTNFEPTPGTNHGRDVNSVDHGGVVVDRGSDSGSNTGGEVGPLGSTNEVLAEPEFQEPASDIAPLESTDAVLVEDGTSGNILILTDATYDIQYIAPIEPLP